MNTLDKCFIIIIWLYILTSLWVLHTPSACQNIVYIFKSKNIFLKSLVSFFLLFLPFLLTSVLGLISCFLSTYSFWVFTCFCLTSFLTLNSVFSLNRDLRLSIALIYPPFSAINCLKSFLLIWHLLKTRYQNPFILFSSLLNIYFHFLAYIK